MKDTLWFHWSPTARRGAISKDGFVPGSLSTDGEWNPPYICFAYSPSLAWCLSGQVREGIDSWDLWQMWSSRAPGYLPIIEGYHPDGFAAEYRVYKPIPAKDIWYVGTRPGEDVKLPSLDKNARGI